MSYTVGQTYTINWDGTRIQELVDGSVIQDVYVGGGGAELPESFEYASISSPSGDVVNNTPEGIGVSSAGECGGNQALINGDEVLTLSLNHDSTLGEDAIEFDGAIGGSIEFGVEPGSGRDLQPGESVSFKAYVAGHLVFEGTYINNTGSRISSLDLTDFLDGSGNAYAGQVFDTFDISAGSGSDFAIRDIQLNVLQDIGDADASVQSYLEYVDALGDTSAMNISQLLSAAESYQYALTGEGLAGNVANPTSVNVASRDDGNTTVFTFTDVNDHYTAEDGQADIFVINSETRSTTGTSDAIAQGLPILDADPFYQNIDTISGFNPVEGDIFLAAEASGAANDSQGLVLSWKYADYETIPDYAPAEFIQAFAWNNVLRYAFGDFTTEIDRFSELATYQSPTGDPVQTAIVQGYYNSTIDDYVRHLQYGSLQDPDSLFFFLIDRNTDGSIAYHIFEVEDGIPHESVIMDQLARQGFETVELREAVNNPELYVEEVALTYEIAYGFSVDRQDILDQMANLDYSTLPDQILNPEDYFIAV